MPSRPPLLTALFFSWLRSVSGRLSAILANVLIGLVLAGCASQTAYREGKELIAQGKTEEGLAKLQEAHTQEPRSAEYKAAYIQTRERMVFSYIEQADRQVGAGQLADAEKLYQRALDIDFNSERARAGLRALDAEQRHTRLLKEAEIAWEKRDGDSAQLKLATILTENPNHSGALALKRIITEKNTRLSVESTLSAAYRKPITIEFKDVAIKQVFEVISRTSGLNFLFDKDVKTDQKTSIFLKNSTIESAVYFTLLTNQLEQQVLDANTILIYPSTPAKQKEYQEVVVKSFFLTNADAKSVANTLKTITQSRDVVIDEKLNMLIVRDSPEAMRIAEKLVALHDVPEPEVMLEVEILEIKRTRLLELGIRWPNSLSLTPLPLGSTIGATTGSGTSGSSGTTTGSTGSTLSLRDLGRQNSSSLGVAIAPVTINARKEDSDANLLANPRIRARNHEKAKILIGERVPNITTTATSTGFVSESINYVDVGLTLNVEPTIYLDNDVAIKISLEVSNIVGQLKTQSGSVAYQIGTRTASTVLRLKDGENQVLAGLINDEDRRTENKVPGLGKIPIIGRLFGSTADDNQKTEIVLSITPRLIRNIQRPEATQSEFRAGTDGSFRVRPDSVGGTAASGLLNPNTSQNALQALPPPQPNAADNPNAQKAPTPPVGNTQLRWQGPTQLKVGDTLALQLTMQSDQPITGLPMAASFDNRVLQVMSITEGNFLKQGGAQTNFTSRVDPNGQILMTSTRSGDGGATNPGVVATINFRTLAPSDISRVQLLTVAAVGLAGSSVATPLPEPYALQVQP